MKKKQFNVEYVLNSIHNSFQFCLRGQKGGFPPNTKYYIQIYGK